ncbi:MAG: hypothetical protein AAFV53_43435, partial [Myxococcota bacterium]
MKKMIMAGALLSVLVWATMPAQAQQGPPNISAESATQTTADEKLAFTRDALTEMNEALGLSTQYLEQAQADGDEDTIQCVRLKQASIKALRDVSERANMMMQDALSSGSPERSNHEFRKVAVALSKVRQFMAEA